MPSITGLRSSSSQQSLQVMGAGGLVNITFFRAPSKAQQGESIAVEVDVWNTEVLYQHDVFVTIYDTDTGGVVAKSSTVTMDAGTVTTFYFSLGAMPNKDWKLQARASTEIMEEPTGADVTIQLWILVTTSLTLSLSPARVGPGQSFIMTGKLSRGDAVDPGVRSIALKINGTSLGSATTDAQGNYSLTKTAPWPTVTQSYTVTATFSQVDNLAAALAWDQMQVEGAPVSEWAWLLLLAGGAVAVWLATGKR